MSEREVLVDSSEASTPLGRAALDRLVGTGKFRVRVAAAAADYVMFTSEGEPVCVERATLEDFWNKLTSGRLFDQLFAELGSCSRLYYALVGYGGLGRFARVRGRAAVAQVEGAVTAVGRAGAAVVPIWDEGDFPSWLVRLAEREAGARAEEVPARKLRKRARSPVEVAIDILTALPGVGSATAARIVADCDSVRDCLTRLAADPVRFLSRHMPTKRVEEAVRVIAAPLRGGGGEGEV